MSQDILSKLQARGVSIPVPSQVVVAPEVDPQRIEAGAELLPGCRIEGARTLIRSGARIGTQGSAWVSNCAIGRGVSLASGSFEGAVFLDGASHGPAGHVRSGTIFEEGASAGHAAGTKQTILLPFATLGSNVNFCDALLAGGRDAKDHSEVGSGFIHFNFTPFGAQGDKATPSLFGDVARGVWLREDRVFLGGAGGVVGPVRVGYGAILAAGGVYRRDHLDPLLILGERFTPREIDRDLRIQKGALQKVRRNLAYMGNLCALRAFYTAIRGALATDELGAEMVLFARRSLASALKERVKQLGRYVVGLELSARLLGEGEEAELQRRLADGFEEMAELLLDPDPELREECEGELSGLVPEDECSYLEWVRGLGDEEAKQGAAILERLVEGFAQAAEAAWLED